MPFDDGGIIKIALVNEAKTDPGVKLADLVVALEVQIERDVALAWGLPQVKIDILPTVPAGYWGLVLLDDADAAGALGYHDLTPHGMPLGKVFVRTTLDDGGQVSVTVSHELLEMLIDPGIQICAEGPRGFYAYEICDACEEIGYEINGITVSDFVYPAWFESFRMHSSGIKYNHLDTIRQPFELLPGGYIGVFRGGRWTQVFGSEAAERRFNPARKRRAVRRAGS